MAEKFSYHSFWEIENFTTRRHASYKIWPFEARVFDSFGKVYNPSCIVSYKREDNSRERKKSEFYLSVVDGAFPKDLIVQCLTTIKVVNNSIYNIGGKNHVEQDKVFLFNVITNGSTLRVVDEVMEYSREDDYIGIKFTLIMFFSDPVTPKRTITPAINVPRKRRCYLCSAFKNLYDSKEMADVTITVDGVSLLAHKLVLVTHSPVFKAMLDNNCLESNTKNIQITDADASNFDNFLKCLYYSEIGDKSYDMVRNLYVLADKYAVDGLKEDCRDILEAELHEGTVCQLLEMSHLFKDETLSEKAVEFIKQNFSAVSKKPEWLIICKDHPEMASDVLREVTLFLDNKSKSN
nr:TD and POZ domain-containing protein 3-like [Parasteatoda tepidariorum]